MQRDAEVVGLDGDERHPKHQRSPEQLSGAGDAQIAARGSIECGSQQFKYRWNTDSGAPGSRATWEPSAQPLPIEGSSLAKRLTDGKIHSFEAYDFSI